VGYNRRRGCFIIFAVYLIGGVILYNSKFGNFAKRLRSAFLMRPVNIKCRPFPRRSVSAR
jgi:hypothetical protein